MAGKNRPSQKENLDFSKQTPIYSQAKSSLFGIWFGALGVSLIAIPIYTRGLEQANNTGVKILLMAIILLAMFLMYSAIRETLSWFFHGRTPLFLDPPTPAVGGEIGGTVVLNHRYPLDAKFKVTLSNHYVYTTTSRDTSRSGNGQTRTTHHSDLMWRESSYAHIINQGDQSALEFCFNVPKSLKPTQGSADSGYTWEVSIVLEETKLRFMRTFTIEAKNGKETSKYLSVKASNSLSEYKTQATLYSELPLTQEDETYHLHYLPFTASDASLAIIIFASIFGVIGLGILLFADAGLASFVGSLFFMMGSVGIIYGLYEYFLETRITITKEKVSEKLFLFGILIKETEIDLTQSFKLIYLDLFKQVPKKKSKGFNKMMVAITQDKKHIILVKYVKSQDKIKKMFHFFNKLLRDK